MSRYGMIVAAGKQSRFELNIPKALVDIDGVCLLDINYNILSNFCDKVFVVCSYDNEKYFDEKYNKIVIESGKGSGDAILKALKKIKDKIYIDYYDDILIMWGDCLINHNLIEYLLNNYESFIDIPCIFEDNPYVSIEKENQSVKVLFSKYGDNIDKGYHDQCVFNCNINYLQSELEEFVNRYYDYTMNNYNHIHGNEFEFLDLFNDLKTDASIIEVPKEYKTLSFNSLEELKKCIIQYNKEKQMENNFKLLFTKTRDVKSPLRAHNTDAGIDFFVPNDFEKITLKSNEDILIDSGIKVIVPKGYALIFKEKSGVATKKKLTIGAAVVDSDYRGVVHFHLFNNGLEDQEINPGDKIIQGLVIPVSLCETLEISEDKFNNYNTERGTGGFGSTGDN